MLGLPSRGARKGTDREALAKTEIDISYLTFMYPLACRSAAYLSQVGSPSGVGEFKLLIFASPYT